MDPQSIPVDIFNPGQVFACMGFLEAADRLCGHSTASFDWSDESAVRFILKADGTDNPFKDVLQFLEKAEIQELSPECKGFEGIYPTKIVDKNSKPVLLSDGHTVVVLDHWTDGSGRQPLKLYAGNRSGFTIVSNMFYGGKDVAGFKILYQHRREDLTADPFNVLTMMKGSFNFDPRGAWMPIDAGFSPNEHDYRVLSSPLVEIMAVWGLSYARPVEIGIKAIRYGIWHRMLPPVLARVALSGDLTCACSRMFLFRIEKAGSNSILTFAEEEVTT